MITTRDDMTTTDTAAMKLQELKALAEAATQGNWAVREYLGKDEAYCDWHKVGPFDLMGGTAGANSRFIAAANPAAILALLADRAAMAERLAALEEAIGKQIVEHGSFPADARRPAALPLTEALAKHLRALTLDYVAMHFDDKHMVSAAYVVQYLRELKDAPIDISGIAALAALKGQAK